MVRVVELRREEDLLAGHARRLDTLADLALVPVRGRGVDVPVPSLERDLDGLLDETRLRLPGACAPPVSATFQRRLASHVTHRSQAWASTPRCSDAQTSRWASLQGESSVAGPHPAGPRLYICPRPHGQISTVCPGRSSARSRRFLRRYVHPVCPLRSTTRASCDKWSKRCCSVRRIAGLLFARQGWKVPDSTYRRGRRPACHGGGKVATPDEPARNNAHAGQIDDGNGGSSHGWRQADTRIEKEWYSERHKTADSFMYK